MEITGVYMATSHHTLTSHTPPPRALFDKMFKYYCDKLLYGFSRRKVEGAVE